MHIPPVDNVNCFFIEANIIFRMAKGEIWFLDASQIHSVAVLSDIPLPRLMFDFVDIPSTKPLLTVDGAGPEAGILTNRTVSRPPLPDAVRRDLLALADVLAPDAFSETFSIVIEQNYRYYSGDFV